MGGTVLKKITLVLGIITAVFGGYYIYLDRSTANLEAAEAEQSLQAKLADTSVFISYSQELNKINLDLSLFEDQRFRSLRLYTEPIKEQPTGRPNPFSDGNQ